jgi:hypothetical protein
VQQLVEGPGPDELLPQQAQRGQDVEVRGDTGGFGADSGGDGAGCRETSGGCEPGADPLDQKRGDRRRCAARR